MPSVRARKDNGKLYFDFQYLGQRCREYTLLDDTRANRRLMQKMLDKIEADITLNTFDYSSYFPNSKRAAEFEAARLISARTACGDVPSFEEWADTWFNENLVRWRSATRESNLGAIEKHLKPRFGDKPISAVTKPEVLAFRGELASLPGKRRDSTLTAKTINHIIGVLGMIMAEAAERYDINDPCRSIKRLRQKRVDINPFSLDEVPLSLARVRPDVRDYFTVRFFTGVRTGELHGLRWKHIDFARRQILIRETFSKGRWEYTKTDGSQREVDMSSIVFDALEARYQALSPKPDDLVFPNANGEPLNVQNVTNRVWYPLLRYLGLEARRPYQCRHTAATLWLASNENPEWIARQLGHTTTEMLFKTYSRYVPNLTRRDGSAFEQVLKSRGFGNSEAAHA